MSDEISLAKGWTLEAYIAHNEAIRSKDERFEEERDRRYTEVGVEREKALKIKETADLAALGLAREIQTYKDEKANELRSQIERERGAYVQQGDLKGAVEKIEETIKPLATYVAAQQGGPRALTSAGILATLGALGVLAALYFGTHRVTPVITTPPVTVTTATTP